jgi:hypothetical protein
METAVANIKSDLLALLNEAAAIPGTLSLFSLLSLPLFSPSLQEINAGDN